MKIVAIDDYEFWIGESVEACVAAAAREHGNLVDDEQYADAGELSDETLDRLKFQDTDEDERPIGEPRTFREELANQIAADGAFPRPFACSEY